MSTLNRLKLLVNQLIADGHFKNKTDLATAIGEKSASGLSELLSGNKRIRVDHIENLKSEVPTFDSNWLLTGQGEIYRSESYNMVSEPQSTYVPGKSDISSLLDDISSRLDPEGKKLVHHLKVEIDEIIGERDKAKDQLIELIAELKKRLK